MDFTFALGLLLGLAAGGWIGWLIHRARAAEASAMLRADNARLIAEISALEARPSAEAIAAETSARMKDSFAALATSALQSSTEQFLALANERLGNVHKAAVADLGEKQQALGTLIAPIRDTLTRVGETLAEVDRHRVQDTASLRTLLGAVGQAHQQLQQETQGLVRALRSPGVRGRWGEVQLRKVVEMAGMLEHCDFEEQPTAYTDEGRLRPDLIVKLPGGRTIVVDAKAPLEAFLDAQAASDPGVRSGRMADHVRLVRDHVTKLGAKAYWDQFPASPDFAVLFLPAEAIFMGALEQDAQLIEHGVKQRVLIASPLTLIALLRAAALGWRQERLNVNAEEISQLGRELYDRVRLMTDRLDTVGTRLDSVVRAYNEAVGTYESRVLVSVRRFRELGAATGQEIGSTSPVDTTPRKLESASQLDLPDASVVDAESVERV
jgi:DNA recombination protein RmuC